MNNARYQRCERVRERHTGWTRTALPARLQPHLDLIERTWRQVKKHSLTNRYHPTSADFRLAIDRCLNALDSSSEDLRSLLTLNFHFYSK